MADASSERRVVVSLADRIRAPSAAFGVEVSTSEGQVTLTMRGELDLSNQRHLAAALVGIEASSAEIILDLADLTFIDAGSIGLIHRARNLARLRGTDVVLRSPNPSLHRILELTGLGPETSYGPLDPPLPMPSSLPERQGTFIS